RDKPLSHIPNLKHSILISTTNNRAPKGIAKSGQIIPHFIDDLSLLYWTKKHNKPATTPTDLLLTH
ncbi:MAG: hypothetical protein ACRCZA_06055, partial [Shewanella sp.]|uniref:hypothetical protein n=1 Tax=Shewanella sp. TaxID=50422 RepID=UPI003F3B79B7